MIIEPAIRSNICINAHPLGSKQFVQNQIDEVKLLGTFPGPKNVLIIGGSSGYGLSSRIALAFGARANTINVSFESGPSGKRTGVAGWWNNIYFQQLAKETNRLHKDFNGDAFSQAMKNQVIDYIKHTLGSIDLVVYSLASPVRNNESTNQLVRSAIKAIGSEVSGKTIDIASRKVLDLTVQSASEEEIKDTVYVMGGEDWLFWIQALDQAGLLAKNAKTISYTYIGGETTTRLYRGGTLGKAKEDLEAKAVQIHELLTQKYQGEALISSSKAVVTKASVFIPQMPIYVSCIYEVMKKRGVHESITAHKHRLFKDMVYGNKRIVDDKKRIRLDHLEMDPSIQEEAIALMNKTTDQGLFDLDGTKLFIEEFYKMNGFGHPEVNYLQDISIEDMGSFLAL
ncbi:MAG: trans-2-enoyl-CoA reductase family protein [bacterium]|nr:trans-2-enoyl-CoA reductase family protein [bacterium]